MISIIRLIKELCPNGVVYKNLGDVCSFQRGTSIVSKNASVGDIPVISGGKTPAFYHNISNRQGETITVAGSGAYAGFVSYWNIPIFAADCFTVKPNSDLLMTKFVYHFLLNNQQLIFSKKKGAGVPHVHSTDIVNLQIPIPPIPIQQNIVGILETFTRLESMLKAELKTRKKQYLWVQQKLLTLQDVKKYQLKDICKIEKGKTPIQKAEPGIYPLVVTTDERKTNKTYQFDCKAVCLSLVSARGHGIAQVSRVFYQEGKFALGNILCAIIPNDEEQTNAKFLRYYLFYAKDWLLVPLMKGGANVSLHISDLEKVKIPLPKIEEQNKIVSILDSFNDILNGPSGIPAEIAARHKQYEYYRDQLLTFKRKA